MNQSLTITLMQAISKTTGRASTALSSRRGLASSALVGALVASLTACQVPSGPDAAAPDVAGAPQSDAAAVGAPGPVVVPVETTDTGEVVLIPVNSPTRVRKRMSVPQLDAAIRKVTGGIGWVEIRSGKEVNLFTELSSTLGRPDYILTTHEDLSPSVLMEKFLGDASRSVCDALVNKEREQSADERVLMTYVGPKDTVASAPLQVDENLRYLLLRYHGTAVESGSSELNLWTWLFDAATVATGDPVLGWRAVCVGLISHPDFYSN